MINPEQRLELIKYNLRLKLIWSSQGIWLIRSSDDCVSYKVEVTASVSVTAVSAFNTVVVSVAVFKDVAG